jgi:hypothetical protein
MLILAIPLTALANEEPRGKRAQSLGDFKAAVAAAHPSCNEIVYPSEREKCTGRTDEITKRCKEESWSCDKPGPDGKPLDPTALKAKLQQNEDQITKLKADKEKKEQEVNNISEAKDNAKREQLRREIQHLADDIVKLEGIASDGHQELIDKERSVADKMSAAEVCVSLREQSTLILNDAKSYADDEDDKAIAPLAKQLATRYADANGKHAAASDVYNAAKSKCESLKRKF